MRALAAVRTDLDLILNFPSPQSMVERRDLINLIRSVAKPKDFESQMKEGFKCGMIAGQILLEAVLQNGTGDLSATKKRIAAEFVKSRQRLSVKTIDNAIWKQYRCVAPYWAAHITFGPRHSVAIPCLPIELQSFLAMVDRFRVLGETGRTRQSPTKSILRPSETVPIRFVASAT
ncbi:hypothetical protein ACFSOZ_30800 [Mesorhizobium newzealandense]|uniref:Uncharacterized protein n=1 Tax=Mesorhizobium newzealandense TaxID=1300302 RepID=A0ABW4UIN4_9HYPH